MLYLFNKENSKQKTYLDLPNCTITSNDSKYVIKDAVITLFELNEDGETIGEGKVVNNIELSEKHYSIFNKLAKRDNYNFKLDKNDLEDLEKSEFKEDIKDVWGDIKIKRAKIRDDEFKIRVKDKETKEIDTLVYEENKDSLWNRFCQWIKPKSKIKYKTVENGVKVKHKTKVIADNVQTIPAHEYTVGDIKNPATIANQIGISQYRLIEANPQIKMANGKLRALKEGEKLNIPKFETVTKLNSATLEGIAEQVGVSKAYIEDILFGIEGRNSKPDLKPYYDGVKDRTHPKGYLTIGFGHTGRVFGVEMNSKNKDSIEITEEEAYLILAQDIMLAKQDAKYYFGDDFDEAPNSIQEAIIDIIFNKGVSGLERADSPCLNLKEDLENKDYAAAAADAIVDPTIRGLMKRNTYRVMMATRDLRPKKRKIAFKKAQEYYERTLAKFQNDSLTSKLLTEHWEAAKEGNATGFFK